MGGLAYPWGGLTLVEGQQGGWHLWGEGGSAKSKGPVAHKTTGAPILLFQRQRSKNRGPGAPHAVSATSFTVDESANANDLAFALISRLLCRVAIGLPTALIGH